MFRRHVLRYDTMASTESVSKGVLGSLRVAECSLILVFCSSSNGSVVFEIESLLKSP